jgi:hypothetical protein
MPSPRVPWLAGTVFALTAITTTPGRRLFLMRPSDLLLASSALDLVVDPESARNAESAVVGQEVGFWTEEAVDTILARLRSEGRPEIAAVIVRAAEMGGEIPRSEIYDLCGYDDERMLRGFTRPAEVIDITPPGWAKPED